MMLPTVDNLLAAGYNQGTNIGDDMLVRFVNPQGDALNLGPQQPPIHQLDILPKVGDSVVGFEGIFKVKTILWRPGTPAAGIRYFAVDIICEGK